MSAARPELVLKCDLDGDGFVDAAEARACYQQRGGVISGGTDPLPLEPATAAAPTAQPGVQPGLRVPPLRFDQLDLDGDGVIARQEWLHWSPGDPAFAAAHQRALSACDRDGDGLIDLAEAQACDALRLGRFLDGTDPLIGEQVATAAPGTRPDAEGYMPMLFDGIDLDGDGQITRAEWLQWRDEGDAAVAAADVATGDMAAR